MKIVKYEDIKDRKAEPEKPVVKEEPEFLMPGSKSEAAVRSFANAATFGLAPKISAASQAFGDKVADGVPFMENYTRKLKEYLAADKNAAETNAATSAAYSLPVQVGQAVATGGGSLARQGMTNATMAAANAYGNSASEGMDSVGETTKAALTAGALSTVPGGVLKAADKILGGMAKKTATEAYDAATKRIKDLPPMSDVAAEGQIMSDPLQKYLAMTGAKASDDVQRFANLGVTVPPARQVGSEILQAGKDGAAGAAIGGVVNWMTGAPVDPLAAIAGGAAAGAGWGGRNSGFDYLGKVGQKAATSEAAKVARKVFGSDAAGAVNQLGSQGLTKEYLEASEIPTSPFGKLSSWLELAASSPNPEVQAAAEAAEAESTDEESKRKAAMKLQSSEVGRAVSNTESPKR